MKKDQTIDEFVLDCFWEIGEAAFPQSRIENMMIDSLELVEIVIMVEDKFNIGFLDCEVSKLECVQDLIDLAKQAKQDQKLF